MICRMAILVASFNRVSTTVRNLGRLIDSLSPLVNEGLTYEIFLVDDASPDGTAAAVIERFPWVHLTIGSGALFWNGGMCQAFSQARKMGSFDVYLLFNDDVEVDLSEVKNIFQDYFFANESSVAIIGGATCDSSRKLSYSGFNRTSRWRPRGSVRVAPNDALQSISMPNANFLLVPGLFFESIGGLDRRYVHGHGDIDLGLVATSRGVDVLLWRRFVGICEPNRSVGLRMKSMSFKSRLRFLSSPLHSRADFLEFCWKHFPKILFPLYVLVAWWRTVCLAVIPK